MKRYLITSHYLDKCIRTIEEHCYSSSGFFAGDALDQFCSNPKNLQALRLLEAADEIRTDAADGCSRPYIIWLEKKGALHLYTSRQKRIAATKGFIGGIISTIIASNLFPYLLSILPF